MHAPQDDFDDLLDNMDAEFQAAPAAGQPITASQQQALDMDEFERQLAMGELDDPGPSSGAAAGAAAAADGPAEQAAPPVLTASQQAAAEMDEFERQLAFGDEPPVAEAGGSAAAAADGQAAVAADQAAVPVMTASQQVAAEMDEFERRLALGDDPPPPMAGQAPAAASQRAADGSHRQLAAGDGTATVDEGSTAVTTSQQPAAEAAEEERQLAQNGPQHDREQAPSVPSTGVQQPMADDADAMQRQLASSEHAPRTAPPTVSAAAASADKLLLHMADGVGASKEGSPGAKRARTSVDGSAAVDQSARHERGGPGSSHAEHDPGQQTSQRASHTGAGGHQTDAGSAPHEAAAAMEEDHGDENDDMDLADMDDEELLRLVMTQAEEEAGRE